MQSNHAMIITDLGFGDAGKGSIVDYLARTKNVSTVIRHNGGAQAAHNVVTTSGKHHTFHQFGSGTFVPGVRTHLSRFMFVDPVVLFHEGLELHQLGCGNPFTLLTVDEDALVVTPFHRAANRIREHLRGDSRHGTCAMGIGETMADSLDFPDPVRVKDLLDPMSLAKKFASIQERKRAVLQPHFLECLKEKKVLPELRVLCSKELAKMFAQNTFEFAQSLTIVSGDYLKKIANKGSLVFEGAQGVLLDEWYGFHPHTTWSTTTPANALTLLEEIGYSAPIEKIGLLRAYHTRHGAGPFVTEDPSLSQWISEDYNTSDGAQGNFRFGWFDFVMAKYAISVSGGVDSLAITNIDRFQRVDNPVVCTSYAFDKNALSAKEEDILLDTVSHKGSSSLFAQGLKVKKKLTDLSHQELLTSVLNKAQPVYTAAEREAEEYLKCIAENLNVPVSITSFGPTAADKRLCK